MKRRERADEPPISIALCRVVTAESTVFRPAMILCTPMASQSMLVGNVRAVTARLSQRLQMALVGLVFGFVVVSGTPCAASARQAGQTPLRTYCAARVVALSRVGNSASTWRYELAADVPAALSVQLTMQTSTGWYRVAAPTVPLLQDNGTYLSGEARYKRRQIHSPAQFFELPFAAGRPRYLWVSKVGDAGASPQTPCPAMWIEHSAHRRHSVKNAKPLSANEAIWSQMDRTQRLNPSVYNPNALPPVAPIAQAHAVSEPASAATCRHPFRAARILHVVAPSYPFAYAGAGERWLATVAVMVELAPDGSVVGRVLARPSGRKFFDESALYAAAQTTYSPKIGLCRPVPSYYIFDAEFGPE